MKKKCVPEGDQKSKGQGKGKGFGQGKGPVGVPKKEDITMDKVDKLVDEVFDGGFNQFGKVRKAEKTIDMLLDNSIPASRPYDHPIKMKVVATPKEEEVEECTGPMMNQDGEQKAGFDNSKYDGSPSKDDDPKKKSNDINHVPNQNAGGILKAIYDELNEGLVWKIVAEMRKDDKYKSYFRKMLSKYGYKSPADIPADKKKDFFNSVDSGWTAAKEQFMMRSPQGQKSYGGHGSIKGSSSQGGFGSIKGTSTKGGFGSIKGRPRDEEIDLDQEDDMEEQFNQATTTRKGKKVVGYKSVKGKKVPVYATTTRKGKKVQPYKSVKGQKIPIG